MENENKPADVNPAEDVAQDSTPSETQDANPAAIGQLCEERVREQLKQVIDPELYVNIVDLGLIYVVDVKPASEETGLRDVHVEMTLTSPMCPAGPQLVGNSRQVIGQLEGVGEIDIKVVMEPAWTQDMMSEDARDQLGIF